MSEPTPDPAPGAKPAAPAAPTVDKAAAISGLRSLIAMQAKAITAQEEANKKGAKDLTDLKNVQRQYQKALAPLLEEPPDKLPHSVRETLGLVEK